MLTSDELIERLQAGRETLRNIKGQKLAKYAARNIARALSKIEAAGRDGRKDGKPIVGNVRRNLRIARGLAARLGLDSKVAWRALLLDEIEAEHFRIFSRQRYEGVDVCESRELVMLADVAGRICQTLTHEPPLDGNGHSLFTKCPTCLGGGYFLRDGDDETDPCEDCNGEGLLPNHDLAEFARSEGGRQIRTLLTNARLIAGWEEENRHNYEAIRADVRKVREVIEAYTAYGKCYYVNCRGRIEALIDLEEIERSVQMLDGAADHVSSASWQRRIADLAEQAIDRLYIATNAKEGVGGRACGRCVGTGLTPERQPEGDVELTGCSVCEGTGEEQDSCSGPGDAERVLFREQLNRSLVAIERDIWSDRRGQSGQYLERLAAHAELWLRSKSHESRHDLFEAIKRLVASGFEGTEGGAR